MKKQSLLFSPVNLGGTILTTLRIFITIEIGLVNFFFR